MRTEREARIKMQAGCILFPASRTSSGRGLLVSCPEPSRPAQKFHILLQNFWLGQNPICQPAGWLARIETEQDDGSHMLLVRAGTGRPLGRSQLVSGLGMIQMPRNSSASARDHREPSAGAADLATLARHDHVFRRAIKLSLSVSIFATSRSIGIRNQRRTMMIVCDLHYAN